MAATTPSRGVAYENDGAASGKWKVEECSAGPLGGVLPPVLGGTGVTQTTGALAPPVKLAWAKVQAPSAGRSRSS